MKTMSRREVALLATKWMSAFDVYKNAEDGSIESAQAEREMENAFVLADKYGSVDALRFAVMKMN